jgi:hypothetical protein
MPVYVLFRWAADLSGKRGGHPHSWWQGSHGVPQGVLKANHGVGGRLVDLGPFFRITPAANFERARYGAGTTVVQSPPSQLVTERGFNLTSLGVEFIENGLVFRFAPLAAVNVELDAGGVLCDDVVEAQTSFTGAATVFTVVIGCNVPPIERTRVT